MSHIFLIQCYVFSWFLFFFKQTWSIVKLFKSIEWCATQMFYLPYAGLTPRQRPMSPSQAALAKGTMPFAFDGFRTWSFHTVWTCLTCLDIPIPMKKLNGFIARHESTNSTIIYHYQPSSNLLDKRLLQDCFHSKQILTVRNEEMKWYIYVYIYILFNYI